MKHKKCLWCGKKLKANRKKFCCNKHKDRWHNWNNPRGRFAHLHPDNLDPIDEMDRIHDKEPAISTEALGQE